MKTISLSLLTTAIFAHLSFSQFKETYSLGATSTEQGHPKTTHLSHTLQQSTTAGLKQLQNTEHMS